MPARAWGVIVLFVRLFLLLVVVSACARRVPEPVRVEVRSIVDATGTRVTDDELLSRLSDSKYVLLGERHDDACSHQVQRDVVELAARAGLPFALGLEMIDVERFAVLEAFNEGRLDLDGLRRALDWDRAWGYDWWLYAPIIEAAHRAGARVEALNVSKRLIPAVGGALPDDLDAEVKQRWLAPEVLPPPQAQLKELRAVFDAHAHHLPPSHDREAAFEKFVRTQSLWDTQMAWAAREAGRDSRRVFVLVGAGHVAGGWGIEHRLSTFDPGARVLSLVPWAGESPPDPTHADLFFFFCPPPATPPPAG